MRFLLDLHNHSCLSPCGSLDLSPSVLSRLQAKRGVTIGALTDHNATANLPAWDVCSRREGVVPLFGMEAQTREEVHVLCLFSTLDGALAFGAWADSLLPKVPNNPEAFGDQIVVDADEFVLDELPWWLGNSLETDVDGLCAAVSGYGGIVVPAHVDRPAFGMISQLGFIPDGPYAALESVRRPFPGDDGRWPVISGSDAHYPEHVARRPFLLETDVVFVSGGCVDLEAFDRALRTGIIIHGSSAERMKE